MTVIEIVGIVAIPVAYLIGRAQSKRAELKELRDDLNAARSDQHEDNHFAQQRLQSYHDEAQRLGSIIHELPVSVCLVLIVKLYWW